MTRLPRRVRARMTVLILAAAAAAGCASTPAPAPRSAIPPEFRAACGHPGAQVEARKVPETISHADCDLTGVTISYRNYGGATVPRGHGGSGIGNSGGFTLTIHPGTLDVTVDATGVPGNA